MYCPRLCNPIFSKEFNWIDEETFVTPKYNNMEGILEKKLYVPY